MYKLFPILSFLAGNTQTSSRQSSQSLTNAGKVSFFFQIVGKDMNDL